MSNEVILNLSFDNQTVTDLTGNWTLDGTPNATYEQIDGRDGYSLVTGSLGRCIVLNAVDQNAVYNEYTVDFDMFIKSTYTSNYYFYYVNYLWSRINPGNSYNGKIGDVLDIYLKIGGSDRDGTTNYSPIGRWVHVTLTSGPTGVDDQYCTTVYVDGVKLIDRTDGTYSSGDNNPFALSQQIIPLARDTDAKLMPNGPGICLNTFKVVTGIHIPDQNPAISLFNLNRVFNNFCTWLKGKLSTVAFTGSYNDLRNKPTISTVNDGTLTIQQNGTNVQTFTANASTNKTANIQCVDLSTAQTIGGQKIFSSSPMGVGRDLYHFASNPYAKNTPPTNTSFQYIWFGGNTASQGFTNSWYSGYLEQVMNTNGSARGRWLVRDTSENIVGIELWANGSDRQVRPQGNNVVDLGSSTNKWKSFNGINPGALSLPSDTYITIDTTSFAWSTNFTFTPSVDGYLFISIGSSTGIRSLSLKTGRGEYYFTNQSGILRFTMPVYKGNLVTILANSTEAETVIPILSLFPCQGNV